ncbi:MAG: metal ABC transporter substrate-binding protein [Bacilli bacterium]|nr:metal ABC transporter substrate-binding protein [Bacilli bacterium]
MKKIYSIVLVMLILITGCSSKNIDDQISIVSTIFPGYDFARAVSGENVNLTMLVKPGTDSHSYDPSPKDIIEIKESDIFIYVGGESEEWVEEILDNLSSKTIVIRLMDLVELKDEETVEGMQEKEEDEDEYDEHIWTSPINAIKMIQAVEKALISVDEANELLYEENAATYIEELTAIDEEIRTLVSDSTNKTLVFADRFPFRYFVDEYDLDYKAAFPGCSQDTEADAKTITYLIDYVNDNNIPVVFYIELSNQNLADTIVEATGTIKLELQSAHNLTQEEFDNGLTYVDIMKQNIANLKEALN